MNNLKHTKTITRTPRPGESTVDITRESYTDKLSSSETQVEQSIVTSMTSIAADVMACLRELVAGETPELSIVIKTNKQTGKPERIIKTWTTNKEYYGR